MDKKKRYKAIAAPRFCVNTENASIGNAWCHDCAWKSESDKAASQAHQHTQRTAHSTTCIVSKMSSYDPIPVPDGPYANCGYIGVEKWEPNLTEEDPGNG